MARFWYAPLSCSGSPWNPSLNVRLRPLPGVVATPRGPVGAFAGTCEGVKFWAGLELGCLV